MCVLCSRNFSFPLYTDINCNNIVIIIIIIKSVLIGVTLSQEC